MPHPAPRDFDELRAGLRGTLILPDQQDFDSARLPWNLAIDQRPLAVVEAADAADVAALLKFAWQRDIRVSAQPSGHGATGRASDTILLRTSRMNSVAIDAATLTARIGAGVRSGEFQRAAAKYGLTALPGSSPIVSVTGGALGGGLSWFSRSFGWIADSIVAANVVLADGTERLVDESDAELLWALRGGGGEIAIVTSLMLQLHPAPEVFGGRMLWPADHAREIADAYRASTASAPDHLTLWLELLHFPGADPMIAIDCTFLGPEAEARDHLRALDSLPSPLSDSRAMMSPADLGSITAEPTDPGHGLSRAELLTELDDATLETMVDEPIAPLMMVQVRHLGGALAQPSESPHGPLAAPFALYAFGVPSTPDAAASVASKQAALATALPTSGRKPISFLNPAESLSNALPADSIKRLRALKNRLDPKKVTRGNFSL